MKKIFFITIISCSFLFSNTNKDKTIKIKDCKNKKTCKQMSSCSEAKFYLEVCGHTKLDKDKDGVPCENLCK